MTALDDFISDLDDEDRTVDCDEWERYGTLDDDYE